MDRDIESLDWMSAATKKRAQEKLHLIANKVGYPDKWARLFKARDRARRRIRKQFACDRI